MLSPFFGQTLSTLHEGLEMLLTHGAISTRRPAGQTHFLDALAADDRRRDIGNAESIMNGGLII
jgi:hypothetical protein